MVKGYVKKYILFFTVFFFPFVVLMILGFRINGEYKESAVSFKNKIIFFGKIHTASPAIVPAGRNIAFESGNALANAPASYLTMLDCCESDEAIAYRIAMGQMTAKMLKKEKGTDE